MDDEDTSRTLSANTTALTHVAGHTCCFSLRRKAATQSGKAAPDCPTTAAATHLLSIPLKVHLSSRSLSGQAGLFHHKGPADNGLLVLAGRPYIQQRLCVDNQMGSARTAMMLASFTSLARHATSSIFMSRYGSGVLTPCVRSCPCSHFAAPASLRTWPSRVFTKGAVVKN